MWRWKLCFGSLSLCPLTRWQLGIAFFYSLNIRMDMYLFGDAYYWCPQNCIIDYSNSSSINLMFLWVSYGDSFRFSWSDCVLYLVEAKKASGSALPMFYYHLFHNQVQASAFRLITAEGETCLPSQHHIFYVCILTQIVGFLFFSVYKIFLWLTPHGCHFLNFFVLLPCN